MIEELIGGFRAENIDFTAEEIADIVWLWAVMPARKREKRQSPRIPEREKTPEIAREEQEQTAAQTAPAPRPEEKKQEMETPGRGKLLPATTGAGGRDEGVPIRVPGAVALPITRKSVGANITECLGVS
jgi:hypothetical protein